MRLPLPTSLKTRTSAPDKDARMTNCYVETKGTEAVVRKRAGLVDLTNSIVGIGQGGIATDNGAVIINGDQISTLISISTDYTVTPDVIAVDVCGNTTVTLPASPSTDQNIAITNVCGGNVLVDGAVEILPLIVGGGDAGAFKWTSGGGTELIASPGLGYAEASGVSSDGSVIVGFYVDGTDIAFRWTSGTGMVSLGTLPGGANPSYAFGVSSDGAIVVGRAYNSSSFINAFIWSSGTGMVSLGTLGGDVSEARDVSADGSVVVGYATDATGFSQAFRWTSGGGMLSLGTLSGTDLNSVAEGVSSDGTVIVGYVTNAASEKIAFRWTQAGGMVSLGTLTGGANSVANGVSPDGATIVGTADDSLGTYYAFRWTSGTGMVSLGNILDGIDSAAYDVASDGTIVGDVTDQLGVTYPYRWTESVGMVVLPVLLGSTVSAAIAVTLVDTPVTVSVPFEIKAVATGIQFIARSVTTYRIGLSQGGGFVIYDYFYINAQGKIKLVGPTQAISNNLYAGVPSTSTTTLIDNTTGATSKVFSIARMQIGSRVNFYYSSGATLTNEMSADVNLFAGTPSSITAISI